MKNYLVTLNQWAHVPSGSIHRKDGKVDFMAEDLPDANVVKEMRKEVTEDGAVLSAKSGERVKTRSELKKEGRPISKDPKKKDLADEILGRGKAL